MGLIGRGVVFGLGYLAGSPAGRQQLRRQAIRFGRRPEVRRLRERAWDLAEAQTTRALRFPTRRVPDPLTLDPLALDPLALDPRGRGPDSPTGIPADASGTPAPQEP